MGKRRLYDEDAEEVFGLSVAIYFEALRYRQQLRPGEFFTYETKDVTKNTGLTYKQQLRAHKVLIAAGWIESKRTYRERGGTAVLFRITNIALDIIKDTHRKRYIKQKQR